MTLYIELKYDGFSFTVSNYINYKDFVNKVSTVFCH